MLLEQARLTEPGSAFAQGTHLYAMRQLEAAIEHFTNAEAAGYHADSCASARWTCWMLLGDFENAWRESDAIERRGAPDSHRFWDGSPLDNRRVMVRCLRGLGDSIQCARYIASLRPRVKQLFVETPPELLTLFRQLPEIDRVLTWDEEPPAWDAQIEITEFPRYFRSLVETIPASIPYLRVPSNLVQASGERLQGPKPRVGLVWEGSSWNNARSIRFLAMAPILSCSDVGFYSLQRGEASAQMTDLCGKALADTSLWSNSVLETAADIVNLDLVITVDTMVAHLAGALGKSVWTLLPFEADWRWMVSRHDTPWYPTMRLFRQHRQGDWDPTVQQIAHELRRKFSLV